ncbi:MAG: response regulator transcription factor [Sulfurospirillaceae bacterium]|jgi:DNA-binding response OmpR family regulator|nr:response regulator transcription factor [Sulfurospirillaceae bacterium]MCK9546353.1 response regulator transcription factor [Sulfurospirillaceae bacterium]MDY0237372.1 response regulator transcription factor [Campylobacterales bacterium]NLN00222.1 response regulator transcription factor [Campylobacteraceae bacterium]
MSFIDLKHLTILFVEDEQSIRDALVSAIEDEFARVITAKDGEEGFKKFKKYKPDIVVTDISMPVMDGLDMARAIKEISKDTPIIILSAFSERERLIKAIDVKVDKYLIKPIDLEELMQTINEEAKVNFVVGDILEIGQGYHFDKGKRALIYEDKIIPLTKKELLFITLLVKNLGTYVTHEDLKKSVWLNKGVSDAAVRTFIKRVREKTDKSFIKNVPGLGYKIGL